MRNPAGAALLYLAVGWSLSGCGGDSRPADQHVDSSPKVHDFLARFSQVACAGSAACCVASAFDEDACLRDPAPILPFGFADFRDTPHFTFDDAEAERCLEAFQAAMTQCHDPALQVDARYHCSLVFQGDVAEHGSCLWFGDCAYGRWEVTTCVRFDDTEAYGSCEGAGPRLPRTGVEREPCVATCIRDNAGDANCPGPSADDPSLAGCYIEDGLFCNGTCQRLPGAGEPCEGTYCTPDAYCDGGVCKSRGAGACAKSAECTSAICRGGECVARAPLGTPCQNAIECESEFCLHGICETGSYPTDDVCATYPAD